MEIFFWNINNNKSAVDIINKLDFQSRNRIFAIAEFWEIKDYIEDKITNKKFWHDEIYKRTGLLFIENTNIIPYGGEKYYSTFMLKYNDLSILFFVVHLKSKIRSDINAESMSSYIIQEINKKINSNESEHNIIIGDFNQPGYANIFLNVFHLNVTDYCNEGILPYKTCERIKRLKYYNPITSFSGDLSMGPPGTYYYNIPNQSQAWHIYDNALMSYPLVKYLEKKNCKILTELNSQSLINRNNQPNREISDHLPIKIKLK